MAPVYERAFGEEGAGLGLPARADMLEPLLPHFGPEPEQQLLFQVLGRLRQEDALPNSAVFQLMRSAIEQECDVDVLITLTRFLDGFYFVKVSQLVRLPGDALVHPGWCTLPGTLWQVPQAHVFP